MSIQKHTYKNKEEASSAATEFLNQKINNLRESKTPILFLVSGGSAFGVLENLNLDKLDITVGVLDERYSLDEDINNFAQLTNTDFFKTLEKSGIKFIDTRLRNSETQNELALRMEGELKKWKELHTNGQIIITQGIGGDGHTSGVLPFPENPKLFNDLFLDANKWVVGYDASGKNPYPLRVTTTLEFLKLVDLSVVFVCGEDKKDALVKALSETTRLNEVPGSIICTMKDYHLFTDINV